MHYRKVIDEAKAIRIKQEIRRHREAIRGLINQLRQLGIKYGEVEERREEMMEERFEDWREREKARREHFEEMRERRRGHMEGMREKKESTLKTYVKGKENGLRIYVSEEESTVKI